MKYQPNQLIVTGDLSPSMRREWIEMSIFFLTISSVSSPSMRREWIEIRQLLSGSGERFPVSLHAEGVD